MKVLFAFVALCVFAVTAQEGLNPIYPAAGNMKLVKSVTNGKLYEASAGNPAVANGTVHMHVMHIFSEDPTERGYIQGQLLGETLVDFAYQGLDSYYKLEVDSLNIKGLPAWLMRLIHEAGDKLAAPIMDMALGYVFDIQKPFLEQAPMKPLDEIAGLAKGICAARLARGIEDCDVATLTKKFNHVNMLPELVKMQCSMVGAWGNATVDGGLVHLRTLDFGGGPFANASIVTVYHANNGAQGDENGNSFALLGFPGLIGAVTGVSSKIGLSEKLWLVSGASGPQPGTYNGLADAMVIRQILQYSNHTQDAISIAKNADRTWAIFLGIGEFTPSPVDDMNFAIMGYKEANVTVYDDKSIHSINNQTQLNEVAYVDKHPQPSHDQTLPTVLSQNYGKLSAKFIAQNVPRLTHSGDVHIGLYDYKAQKAYFSVGSTNVNGTYAASGYAYARPFLEFDLQSLWNEQPPSSSSSQLDGVRFE